MKVKITQKELKTIRTALTCMAYDLKGQEKEYDKYLKNLILKFKNN